MEKIFINYIKRVCFPATVIMIHTKLHFASSLESKSSDPHKPEMVSHVNSRKGQGIPCPMASYTDDYEAFRWLLVLPLSSGTRSNKSCCRSQKHSFAHSLHTTIPWKRSSAGIVCYWRLGMRAKPAVAGETNARMTKSVPPITMACHPRSVWKVRCSRN